MQIFIGDGAGAASRRVLLAMGLLALVTPERAFASARAPGFPPFEELVARLSQATGCDKLPANRAWVGPRDRLSSPFYTCLQGRAETAKLFIRTEEAQPTQVRRVVVMWNEWTRDVGHGLAADRDEARRILVGALDGLGLAAVRARVEAAFFAPAPGPNRSRDPVRLTSGAFEILVEVSQGPGIAGRTVTITPRA